MDRGGSRDSGAGALFGVTRGRATAGSHFGLGGGGAKAHVGARKTSCSLAVVFLGKPFNSGVSRVRGTYE